MRKQNIIIIAAAGRDFHNFNTYIDNESYNAVAFTATRIPDISGRKYPAELAGKLYNVMVLASAEILQAQIFGR